ncbi:hypothetical protein CSUB01_00855 [Colletotrichum sublineola]|uniref:Uncharacterized protein n=1 Tax=Colletotrichum sublineola TaxID=1173701 RepID=A0A066X813_COLSU|nr:hypothetical protein CSUB01_00855 [Colletotrichum sublineola]
MFPPPFIYVNQASDATNGARTLLSRLQTNARQPTPVRLPSRHAATDEIVVRLCSPTALPPPPPSACPRAREEQALACPSPAMDSSTLMARAGRKRGGGTGGYQRVTDSAVRITHT